MPGIESVQAYGPLDPGYIQVPLNLTGFSYNGGTPFTALKPFFIPIHPNCSQFNLAACQVLVTTGIAASTIGFAVYSWTKTGSATYAASLVPNTGTNTIATASTGRQRGTLTTNAFLDFTRYRYLLGIMGSAATIGVAADGTDTIHQVLTWTAAARANTTDWPSTFTQSSAPANTGNIPCAIIVSDAGLGLT